MSFEGFLSDISQNVCQITVCTLNTGQINVLMPLFTTFKVGGSAPETVQILIKAMKNSEVGIPRDFNGSIGVTEYG